MEVTLAPTPDYLVSPSRPATPVDTAVNAGAAQPEPVPNPPSVLVTLAQRFEPSPVYYEPAIVVSYLRDNNHTKPAAAATSVALMQSLNQFTEKKTTFSVSDLFNQVGALSRETSEYRNTARQFYVPPRVAVDKFSPEFSGSAGARSESAFLTIKTKDGDNIQIQFSRNKSGDLSQMEFSFVVDGELSEAEQNALQKLTEKLGAMGDEFFRMDTTELRGLSDVDTDSIHYFQFTLQRFDPATDSYVEHAYEFRVDEITQTQHLAAEDVRGYSVDIKSQLQTLAKEKVLESELFQQYLDLINKAADDSDTPNASKRFMLDAFESFFSGFFAPASAAEQTLDIDDDSELGRAENALAAFDSGLPDFTASFRSPVLHNPGFYSQIASMVLNLEQTTRVEQNGDNTLIKQESRYEFINHHFEDFPEEYLDELGGNYTYTTEHEQGSVSRILSMTNERVNNVWIEQEASKEKQISQFVNYQLVDQDGYSYSDRRVQEFAELLTKLQNNKQWSAVDEVLQSTKETLFLNI